MRTPLDLPEQLVQDAMQARGSRTKTQVVITALEELIRKQTIAGLKEFRGAVDLDLDLDRLRSRQCRF